MTSREQTFGIEIRLSSQLHDSLCDQVAVTLLFIRVLQKLSGNPLGVNSRSGKIMAPVT